MTEIAHPIPASWLATYYDGELEAARREALEAHLPTCPDCQRELAALKSLSEALRADELASSRLEDKAVFWMKLEPQLPDRKPASAAPVNRTLLFRWLPGISLLALNSAIQAAVVMGTILSLLASQLGNVPTWTYRLDRMAMGASLGWLGWLWPAQWSGLGVFTLGMLLTAGLAVLYLAWLAYEWRYGAARVSPVAA